MCLGRLQFPAKVAGPRGEEELVQMKLLGERRRVYRIGETFTMVSRCYSDIGRVQRLEGQKIGDVRGKRLLLIDGF